MMRKQDYNSYRVFLSFSFLPILLILTVCLGATTLPTPSTAAEAGGDTRRIIVIDPGHGGIETGVSGPEGTLEKDIALALAEKIKKRLEDTCEIHLTRTGDYRLGITERVSIANSHQPDLLISLHTGASFRRAVDRWSIYHADKNSPSEEIPVTPQNPHKWNRVHQAHIQSSIKLADLLKQQLQDHEITNTADIIPAPIKILQGADTPAIAIETGHLTNPQTAGHLADPAYLSRIADAIAAAIENFQSN